MRLATYGHGTGTAAKPNAASIKHSISSICLSDRSLEGNSKRDEKEKTEQPLDGIWDATSYLEAALASNWKS